MRTKLYRWMAACGLVIAAAAPLPWAVAQTAGEAKPAVVAVFPSYDALMKDVDFLGSLAGQVSASDHIEQMVQMFTQQKGLAGLDKSKPIGLIVQTDGAMPSGALCVPVSDLKALLDVAKGFGVTSNDMGDGVMQITTPQGPGAFAKEADGWALLSMAPPMLEGLPADPGALFVPLAKEYDLAVRVIMKNLPEAYRQQAVDALNQGAQAGMTKEPDETDEQYAERQKMMEAQLEQVKQLINDLDELTVGMAIDGQQQKAFIDVAYTAIPGTKLAQDIAANSNVTTNFAGFFQPEAAMTLSFASKMTDADSVQLGQMVETLRRQAGDEIDKDDDLQNPELKAKAKAAVDDFLAALKATLEAGVMDGGASLSMTPDSLTFIAGGFVADPAKVEAGLKKLVEIGEAENKSEMPKIEWAAEQEGDVIFHSLTQEIPSNEKEARQLLGDDLNMVVGVGKKAVYFALGREPIEAVKAAIAASAQTPDKSISPMEMTVALGQIFDVLKTTADESEQPQMEMIADMLTNEANGRDHIRMVSQPIENGVRMRLEAEEGVLRAIGMAAMQAQMQAAGAGF